MKTILSIPTLSANFKTWDLIFSLKQGDVFLRLPPSWTVPLLQLAQTTFAFFFWCVCVFSQQLSFPQHLCKIWINIIFMDSEVQPVTFSPLLLNNNSDGRNKRQPRNFLSFTIFYYVRTCRETTSYWNCYIWSCYCRKHIMDCWFDSETSLD